MQRGSARSCQRKTTARALDRTCLAVRHPSTGGIPPLGRATSRKVVPVRFWSAQHLSAWMHRLARFLAPHHFVGVAAGHRMLSGPPHPPTEAPSALILISVIDT